MKGLIRVLVVDDHEVVRRGVCALLETEEDIVVAGEAEDGQKAIDLATRLEPEVILMDLVMPGLDGIEATRVIRSRLPRSQVLVLTSFGSDDKLFPAIEAGALGYLLKDASPRELVRAIRYAAEGRSLLNPVVARRLLRELTHKRRVSPLAEPLTPREAEVLEQVARGLSNEKIAAELRITEATVRTHVSHILSKLGLENRTQAALHALRTGLVSLDDLSG